MKTKSLTDAAFWDRNYRSTVQKTYPSVLSRSDAALEKRMRPFLAGQSGKSILEIGCGNSYWLSYFSRKYGLNVSGLDFSRDRLLQSIENMEKHNVYGKVILRDLMSPEPVSEQFDFVCSFGVIEHFDPPTGALRKISEYLHHGGTALTTVPNLKGVWGRLSQRISGEVASGFVRMDMQSLLEAHRDAGLEVVHASYMRWMDFGILNFSGLPAALRIAATGCVLLSNTAMRLVDNTSTELPREFYADMIVISRKRQ